MPLGENISIPVETYWALTRGFCLYLLIPSVRHMKAKKEDIKLHGSNKQKPFKY